MPSVIGFIMFVIIFLLSFFLFDDFYSLAFFYTYMYIFFVFFVIIYFYFHSLFCLFLCSPSCVCCKQSSDFSDISESAADYFSRSNRRGSIVSDLDDLSIPDLDTVSDLN